MSGFGKLLCVAGLAALHYIITLAGVLILTARGMGTFDGHPPPPNALLDSETLQVLQQVLMAPMMQIIFALPRDWRIALLKWDQELFVFNSLLWGLLLYWLCIHLPRDWYKGRAGDRASLGRSAPPRHAR